MKAALDKVLRDRVKDTRRWLDAVPLNVAPSLVGLPLATPARRALAMGVDLLLMALLGGVGGLWLGCGLVLVTLLLRSNRLADSRRKRIGWIFAAVLGLLAAQEAWDRYGPQTAEQRAERLADAQQEAADAAAEKAAEAATEAAVARTVEAALSAASSAATSAATSGTSSAASSAASSASAASPAATTDAQRIEQLQAEIAALKKPRPLRWRDQLDRLVASAGVSFGWGVVYFSLLPAWWGGQTLGKKLFQLRVVELTGRPLTVMRCLRRYGGYAAGMATGGLGFLQVLWDVNRQGVQDRVAHTVVVDLRASRRPAPAAADAAQLAAEADQNA